jgi:DNA-binding Lrp family transcriptional regulator
MMEGTSKSMASDLKHYTTREVEPQILEELVKKVAKAVGVENRKNYLKLIRIYLRENDFNAEKTIKKIKEIIERLGGAMEALDLDELDLKILRELQKNSRISYTELKNKLGVVDTTIRKRIKALEEKGVIDRYTVVLNPEKLGLNITAFIGIDTDPNLTDYVAGKLSEIRGVREVSLSTGPHDIFVDAIAKDIKEFGELLETIRNLEGVRKTDANIVVKWFKKKGFFYLPI